LLKEFLNIAKGGEGATIQLERAGVAVGGEADWRARLRSHVGQDGQPAISVHGSAFSWWN